jgi:hypothetical protein
MKRKDERKKWEKYKKMMKSNRDQINNDAYLWCYACNNCLCAFLVFDVHYFKSHI